MREKEKGRPLISGGRSERDQARSKLLFSGKEGRKGDLGGKEKRKVFSSFLKIFS